MKKKHVNTPQESVNASSEVKNSKPKTFFKKVGKSIKEFFVGKQTGTVADVKVEKISLKKSLAIFKGVKLPWFFIALHFVMAIAHAILTFEVVSFSAAIIDSSGAVPVEELTRYIISGCIVGILMVAISVCSGWVAIKINHSMRCKLWDKILRMRQQEMGVNGGELLVSRVTQDCEYASKYFVNTITGLARLTQLIYYFVGMYQLNITMSNFALIFVPISVLLGWLMQRFKYHTAYKRQGFMAMSTAYLVERTKDLALVKTCNAQNKEIAIGDGYFERQYNNQLKINFVTYFDEAVNKILELCALILPFVIGATLFAKGEITIGILVVFNTLVTESKNLFRNIITEIGTIREANGASVRMSKILDSDEEDLLSGEQIPDEVESIKFDNVKFGYTEKIVLDGVSFEIPKNKVTAILGRNGSGKSTSFNLIERLYDLNDGCIKYGDNDVSRYSLKSWRDKVCLIAQGGELMSGTLSSNICYGRDDVTQGEYREVLKLSHVADFIDPLPLHIDPPVLPGGSNYSGGQRQCIAIARAMLSKKPYLLLDEATCNLDVKREHDVIEALDSLMKDRTTVIIAHSLSTIRNADHVVILGDGKVEATGTPADILKETDNYLTKMMQRAAT